MIATGQADYVDDTTIRMHRSFLEPAPRPPRPHTVELPKVVPLHGESFLGQTFISYPQPGSFENAA